MLVAERALGLKPAGGVYVPLRGTDRRARGMVAEELADQLGSDFVDNDRGARGRVRRADRLGRGVDRPGGHAHARRRPGVVPGQLRLARRLLAPLDLPGGDVSAEFTPEQARAVERRDGSVLVSAGAGSGKTSVLVERFVQAVIAGRLRGRLDPGHHVHREGRRAADQPGAQAAAGAGRARAGARGRGGVDLDHPRLLRAGAAHARPGRGAGPRLPRAGRAGGRAAGHRRVRPRAGATSSGTAEDPGRLALLAAYTPDRLADMVRTAHAHLRSRASAARGCRRSPPPRDAGQREALSRGHRPGAGRAGRRTTPSRPSAPAPGSSAARPCWRPWRRTRWPSPATWTSWASSPPPRSSRARRCAGLPRGLRGLRRLLPRAGASTTTTSLLRELMARYDEHYDALKRERSGLDFDDLELVARDLLAGARGRARAVPRALHARDGRRVPGHQPAAERAAGAAGGATTCSGSATSASRSTASATPTCGSSAATWPRPRAPRAGPSG